MDKINNLNNVPRFRYTLGQLPTSFLESMTYQEQLDWLCNYVSQTVTNKINEITNSYNEIVEGFNTLDGEFTELNDNVTETLSAYDTRITNGLADIEAAISAELPSLAQSIINAKIQAGELNCQLGTSYNATTEELTFTIQIVAGD